MTREGAGAEERARKLCEYFAGEEHSDADCPGCLTALDALDAAYAAATAKERERLHALLERCFAAIGPNEWPSLHEALVKELDSCGEQDGAPKDEKAGRDFPCTAASHGSESPPKR